jgi:hypothetical protein
MKLTDIPVYKSGKSFVIYGDIKQTNGKPNCYKLLHYFLNLNVMFHVNMCYG